MNNNSGKGIRSRYFKTFWVMLLVFALVIPSMNGIRIQVHADDTATVWKIYGHNTNNGPTELELVSGDATVAGKDLIGKFIIGGNYALIEEDRDKLIIADNAAITAGNVDVGEFKLSGNSRLIYADFTLSSTESRFTSYAVSQGAITVTGLQAHYEAEGTPYFVDPDRQIWSRSYDLTVSGNFTLAGIPKYDNQNRPVLDEEGHQIIDGNWMGYNDIHVLSGGHIYVEDRGYLLVEGSLKVDEGGTVTGSGEDHYMRVCRGSRVTGLSLYSGPNADDVSSHFYADPRTNNYADFEFRYDSTASKWICPYDTTVPAFYLYVGGFDPNHESIAVQYRDSTGSYVNAVTTPTGYEGDTANYVISLDNIAQNTTTVDLKITFSPAANSNKIMACWAPREREFDIQHDGISASGMELERTFNLNSAITISLNYPNAGVSDIIDTVNNYLYAYAGADEATIKRYLATELYNRFIWVSMHESFGLDALLFDQSGHVCVDENGNEIKDNVANINELVSRITIDGNPGTISAKDKNGNDVIIPVNNYTVNWGHDIENGDPVVSNIPVYTLPNLEDFLICTDFNKDNGTGSTFYIRSRADEVRFDGGGDSAILVLVSSIDPKKIVAGGMGGDTAVSNMDNIFTFSFNSRWLNADQERGASSNTDPVNYGTLVRVMIESETYVILTGEGETKRYGGLNLNGYSTDSVWNTRSNGDPRANVYIGHNILHLKPLAPETGISVREITAVELADASFEAGVHINADNLSDIKITFDSNFYSSIPINITYSDGSATRTEKLTINRVGLVIQYGYLSGSKHEASDRPDTIELGSDSTNEKTLLKYDYYAGEQIVVYGIYYTPSNDPTENTSDLSLYLTFDDGTHRVITADNDDPIGSAGRGASGKGNRGFNGRLAATNDSVATTIFLIGFTHATTFKDNIWIGDESRADFGGFHASVLNAGWNNDDSFGGAQIGSGQGIYWDGKISWY